MHEVLLPGCQARFASIAPGLGHRLILSNDGYTPDYPNYQGDTPPTVPIVSSEFERYANALSHSHVRNNCFLS
jgi:hypothetical protein